MKNLMILLVFTTCSTLKMDVSKSCSNDNIEVSSILAEMIEHHESCDAIQDFLLDTALDHTIEYDCL